MTSFRVYSQREDVMLEKIFDSSGSGLVRVQLLREGLHGSLLDSYSGELKLRSGRFRASDQLLEALRPQNFMRSQ
jgi:hypothetical protein